MLSRLKNILGGNEPESSRPVTHRRANPGGPPWIIVPESAVNSVGPRPELLVQAVTDFVKRVHSDGIFLVEEIPVDANRYYYTDSYITQVGKAGHRQFIHDTGGPGFVWTKVEEGLSAMGASEHLAVFKELKMWATVNRSQFETLLGPGCMDEPVELGELDDRLLAANKSTNITELAARWIVGLHQLQPILDENYEQSLSALVDFCPQLTERKSARQMLGIDRMTQSPLEAAIGLAAMECAPFEPVISIGGAMHAEVDGRKQLVWRVETTVGARLALVNEAGSSLYEFLDSDASSIPAALKADDWRDAIRDGRAQQWQMPRVGQKLSDVSAATIEEAASFAKRVDASAAIERMLGSAALNFEVAFVSLGRATIDPNSEGEGRFAVAGAAGDKFVADVTSANAQLRSFPNYEPVARISCADIELQTDRRNSLPAASAKLPFGEFAQALPQT